MGTYLVVAIPALDFRGVRLALDDLFDCEARSLSRSVEFPAVEVAGILNFHCML